VTRVLLSFVVLMALTAAPAFADHPGPFRTEGMSPLTTALVTGGLALGVALVVVVLVMVLTRPSPDRSESDGQ
jgi:hypothetical protein